MNTATPAGIELPSMPSDQNASGRLLGDEEIANLIEAIKSGTLTSTKGTFTKRFIAKFGEMLGVEEAHACASGTAAIHAAVAAVDPAPGDEIITSPITDMGAITPIIYQTAIPVFADVDAKTGNVTAESISRVISPKTKAIIVTHLFGNPAEMGPIMELADRHGIPVIEDCAQAYGASYKGQKIGTIGAIGCFSLQQGKHITTGEGGMVVTNDAELGRRVRLFIDKAWGYGDPKPDHYFAALNARMCELQGAVALAQLDKLPHSISQRQKMAARLDHALRGLRGVEIPMTNSECGSADCEANCCVNGYWKYIVLVPEEMGGPGALAEELKTGGIASAPRYIQKPAFECQVIRDQVTFGGSRFPFNLARPEAVDYAPENFEGAYKYLSQVLVIPWNENYENVHVDHIATQIAAFDAAHFQEAAE
ncbi:MAG: DegT/DnrJ/EryC1/StrS family aminotransferase [Pseudomonadota bacterium]